MLLTEEQAKERWCPFARVQIETENGLAAANRLSGVGEDADPGLEWPSPRCIASECMAWRWIDDRPSGGRPRGYCGLAGDPS